MKKCASTPGPRPKKYTTKTQQCVLNLSNSQHIITDNWESRRIWPLSSVLFPFEVSTRDKLWVRVQSTLRSLFNQYKSTKKITVCSDRLGWPRVQPEKYTEPPWPFLLKKCKTSLKVLNEPGRRDQVEGNVCLIVSYIRSPRKVER